MVPSKGGSVMLVTKTKMCVIFLTKLHIDMTAQHTALYR